MARQPLTPEDATLLCVSDPEAQLQIGAVCFFEAAPLRDDAGRLRLCEIRRHLEARLHRSPRFRQRLAAIALDAARPVWLDDDVFDVAHHVKAVTLPSPGGQEALRRFVAELLSRPLEPTRPLWQAWFVDGVDGVGGDRVGFVLRVHHVLADGLSLFDAAMLLMDPEPRACPDEGTAWRPEAPPGADRLLAEALVGRTRRQGEIAVGALRPLASLADPRRVPSALRGVAGFLRSGVSTAPPLPLNGRVGRRRDFLWASLAMPDLVAVKRSYGTTLNDVVLAVVTGALRRHLGVERSSRLAGQPPRVLVPVGSRDDDGPGTGNSFSVLVAELPVATADPRQCLAEIHAAMSRHKQGSGSAGASSMVSSLFSVVDVVPLPLLRRLGSLALARQPFANLAVTNIPGSAVPMFLLGAQLLAVHPIVTGVGNIALIIGVLSYGEELGVGITVDPDVVDDPDGLLTSVQAAAAELVERARRSASQGVGGT